MAETLQGQATYVPAPEETHKNQISVPVVIGPPNMALIGLQYERIILSFGASDAPNFLSIGADYRVGIGTYDDAKANYNRFDSYKVGSIYARFYFFSNTFGLLKYFNGFYFGPIVSYFENQYSVTRLKDTDPEISGKKLFSGFGGGLEVGFNLNLGQFLIGGNMGFIATGAHNLDYTINSTPPATRTADATLTSNIRVDAHVGVNF